MPEICAAVPNEFRSEDIDNNRRMGSLDPGYVMPRKEGAKRQPLVQVALDNYEREKKRLAGKKKA